MAVRKQQSTGITVSQTNPATGKQGKSGLWFLSVDGKPAGNFREYPDSWRFGLNRPGGLMGRQITGTKAEYPTAQSFGEHIGQQVGRARTDQQAKREAAKQERATAKLATKQAKQEPTPEASAS